jgi:hypothetical protein
MLPWINDPNIFFGFVYLYGTVVDLTAKLAA